MMIDFSPDLRGELCPDEDVEADPDQLVEGEEAEGARLLVQSLAQLQRPLLGVLLARVHDVLGVQIHHLLETDCIDVDPLVIFGRLLNIHQSYITN